MNLDAEILAGLLSDLADAVILADPDGVIRFWNRSAERLLGWTAEQAEGQPLDLIIPERHRPAHGDGYAKVMATGETRYATDLLQVPALHADGGRRSIAFTVTLLTDGDGAVTGIAAVVRDETGRRAEEKELRTRLAEAEAAREES